MPDPMEMIIAKLGTPVSVNFPEYTFRCPFCIDRVGKEDWKGHLYVNEERGFFCHRCEARGRTFWLMKLLGITPEDMVGQAPEQIDLLRRAVQAATVSYQTTQDVAVQPVELPPDVDYVWNVPEVWAYAVKRGLSRYDCDYYRLLAYVDDFGTPRLLFPDYADGDVLVYWTARAVRDGASLKYRAADESEKSMCVWNLNRVLPDRPIYVAEGIMSARACGVNGVAIYGKYLSMEQAVMLAHRSGPHGVRMVLDADAQKNAIAGAIRLIELSVPCGVVTLPEGNDPDEMPQGDLTGLLLNSTPMTQDNLARIRAASPDKWKGRNRWEGL